ncbi:GntR family transcriptional regulator/MocR family aminotransferase [Deinobacterium chartae]|uniref:GntR family transcriptional regulator/MocR family aminotransferase n=1 Tax=Deinobacterium chartae TaxID=521158 RepID=A0A841HXV7_9DEIO|nr:PLP-dependent aminotransferase family protein [Deinobacterium chartae]MBB6096762.1 GntR family transcriptional regulator/MocR family aminotransferase [Deinobacterium chartae]
MLPPLLPDADTALYRQVYRTLRQAILQGALPPGSRLPSSRAFAQRWQVARNTVLEAFDLLVAEGYLVTRPGSGTFVADVPPTESQPLSSPPPPLRLSDWARRALEGPFTTASQAVEIDFRVGKVPTELFPSDEWAASLRARARDLRGLLGGYGDELGPLETREALCAYLVRERGVLATPDMVMLSSGSQGSLDALARTFLEAGRVAAVEDPGYLAGRRVFAATGATVVPVGVDEQGLDPAQLPERADLLYTTPAHQFPTGAVLPLARRLELLEWASRVGAWVIEDDYNSEFRFESRPLSALQGLAPQTVVYVGTFSKSLSPALRAGYLVAPPPLIAALAATRYLTDRQPPTLDSLALADFLNSGGFARHLRRARARALERQHALLEALRTHLPDWEVPSSGAGLHLYVRLPRGISEAALLEAAAHARVGVDTAGRFALRRAVPAALMTFAHLEPPVIEQGVRRLAAALAHAPAL